MRLILISDTHNQHEKLILPAGDAIIHAGDIAENGSVREVSNFLNWYSNLPYANKIFIAGNHDFALENRTAPISDLPNGITYLENSTFSINRLKIYGSPFTPKFYNWAFMKKRGPEIKRIWDTIPQSVDVLLTHGPPLMVLDQNIKGQHAGCEDLIFRVKQVKPKIHVFGHIHEGYGVEEQFGVKFYNVSVLNDRYNLANKAVIIDV